MNLISLFFLLIFGLVGLFSYQLLRKRKIDRQEHEDLYDIFDRHPIKPPILEIQKITWLPTFTVTFSDKSDYEYAKNNGLIERLNSRIQKQFYDTEFPIEQAVKYRWTK
jgi:hypothetical protein